MKDKVSLKMIGQTLVVLPIGDLDHHSVSDLREQIDKEVSEKKVKNILFDFSEVEFMDSSGIGLIIGRYKLMNSLAGLTGICNMKEELRRIFDVSGLKKIVQTYESIDEAIGQLQPQ